MKTIFTLVLAVALASVSMAQYHPELTGFYPPAAIAGDLPQVVINELDSDQSGGDTQEFIELYGTPNASLTGLSLVFFNGSDDASYAAVSLEEVVLDADGFAVVGNADVPGVQATFNNGLLQNGPDAVAIMIGAESDFPNDTPINTDLVIDALIYITGDNEDDGLLPLVEAGQMYVDEALDGNASINALARIPDGGAPRITETYVAQIPTPGATNILQCDGGTIGLLGTEDTSIEVCVDEDVAEVELTFESSVAEASYAYVIADLDGNIIAVVESTIIDFSGYTPGQCEIIGMSYSGELMSETTEAGMPVEGIMAECVSFSINSIDLTKTDCSIPTCQPGEILLINGQSQGAVCINGDNTSLEFQHESPEESFELLFVLATEDDEIIEVFDEPFYDFSGLTPGNCRLYAYVHQGNVDEETTGADLPVSGIEADICGELTPEFVAIQKLECDENGGCTDLFISEYLEGTSNNKAIEVYNPTPFNIDLSNYTISTFNNGSATPTNQDQLQGALAPGDVYVISHAEANTFILNEADETSGISWFNGNDAIALYNNNVLIDILGIIGTAPITPWEVNGVEAGMAEHTLVRNPLINSGETDWAVGQTQWDVYPQNSFEFIGFHSMAPCNFDETPTVSFNNTIFNTLEGNTLNVFVNIQFPSEEVVAEVTVVGGTADLGTDYPDIFPQTLTFPAGEFNPQSFMLTITDDLILEGDETIELQLTAITEGVSMNNEFLTITILANDMETPIYQIGEVISEDEQGVADSLDVICELRGVVHG